MTDQAQFSKNVIGIAGSGTALFVAAVLFPAITVPLLGLGYLGVALIGSTVKYRNKWFFTRVILGAALAIAGLGSAVTVMLRSI